MELNMHSIVKDGQGAFRGCAQQFEDNPMKNLTIGCISLLMLASTAHAQTPAPTTTQTPATQAPATQAPGTQAPATNGDTPAVATPDTANPTAPVAGANSFTEAQAKTRLEEAGYADVMDLKLDDQGVWRAMAKKDGASTAVSLDFQGNVTAGK
jgi:hypothetical protein